MKYSTFNTFYYFWYFEFRKKPGH